MTSLSYCKCKDCKKMKRKGFILGTVNQSKWNPNTMSVSAYVPFPRFAKGKDPVKFAPSIEME